MDGKGGRVGRGGRRAAPTSLAVVVLLAALTVPTVLSAQSPTLSLSSNPLTSSPDSVVFRWPRASSGPATVAVYSLLGTPVATATLDPDPGRWAWYGRTTGGAAVTNGAYLVVVVRGDGARMRRRLIVER